MELIISIANVIGIVIYAITAISSSVNMAVLYARGETTYIWLRELLWAFIAIFQLAGLVLISVGEPDPRLWLLNRFFWLLFAICVTLMAWKSITNTKIAWRERR